jgi:uncharacterized cupin superfamily protein
MSAMRVINLNEPQFEYDAADPEPYRAGMDRFGPKIGAGRLGGTVYELPPGQSICPYHYEYGEEEWLVVLDGPVAVRHVDGEDELRSGDVTCFAPGPDGAHKVTNRGEETARVLMVSTIVWPAVTVYPDSDKVGVHPAPDDRRDHVIVRRADTRDYYDGEV